MFKSRDYYVQSLDIENHSVLWLWTIKAQLLFINVLLLFTHALLLFTVTKLNGSLCPDSAHNNLSFDIFMQDVTYVTSCNYLNFFFLLDKWSEVVESVEICFYDSTNSAIYCFLTVFVERLWMIGCNVL